MKTRWKSLRKKLRRFFSLWTVRAGVVLVPFALGLFGYYVYYSWTIGKNVPNLSLNPFSSTVLNLTVYSAVRLFTLCFDVSAKDVGEMLAAGGLQQTAMYCLLVARYIAPVLFGNAALRLLNKPIKSITTQLAYHRLWHRKGELAILIGGNGENRMIYHSAEESGKNAVILCSAQEMERDRDVLWADDIAYVVIPDMHKELARLTGYLFSHDGRKINIIINTQKEEENLSLCRSVINCLKTDQKLEAKSERHRQLKEMWNKKKEPAAREEMMSLERELVGMFQKLKIVVFGKKDYLDVYHRMQRESLGMLEYTNKYQIMAYDFISSHPLTEPLVGNQAALLDDYACVARDSAFNVMLVGFGGANQEIFTASLATNQLIEREDGRIPTPKAVRYHIFDKAEMQHNKNLNHTVFRYILDFKPAYDSGSIPKEEYLAQPGVPSWDDFDFVVMNANDNRFYDRIRKICSSSPKSVNQMVIDIGNDLENLDLAQKLASKKREWSLPNLYLFVRVRDLENDRSTAALNDHDYQVFGDEKTSVFTLNAILHSDLEQMAFRRNRMYEYENTRMGLNGCGNGEETETHASFLWNTMDINRRLSNFFAILSLRMKLQLMRLDYREKNAAQGHAASPAGEVIASNEAYFRLYAEDRPDVWTDRDGKAVHDESEPSKPIYSYSRIHDMAHYTEAGLRRYMTVQEHYRWNAFMIVCGFIPARISQMKRGNVKDYALRTHGNLTTFEGLFDYRKIAGGGSREAEEDVIKYDYQLMDDAWWFLNHMGYEIYRR